MNLLFVPGWKGSGPMHWQTIWQEQLGGRRVEQEDWENPDPAKWVRRLDESICASEAPVLLVAHSLGALTAALWAATYPVQNVAGAFLVAPPDPVACCPVIGQFLG